MILTVCMSPCTDMTIEVDSLNVGRMNVIKNKSVALGGKALHVAIGVQRLGYDAYATGMMYEDNGALFETALSKEGVPCQFVWNKGRARENYKFIDNRSMLTEVNDIGAEITTEKAEELLKLVASLSARSDVTVLSGGLPKGVEHDYYARLVHAVNADSLKIVDASGARLFAAIAEGVDLVRPNIAELENAIGKSIESKEDMLAGCYELLDRGAKRVLLSLGKDGAVITDGSQSFHCKSLNVALNPTVGAGDAMVAAAAIQLKDGASLPDILRAGVAAGTASIMTVDRLSFTKEKYDEVYGTLSISRI
ncbi:MAG: hexose kinase [Clostridia bacterium]|nr:hexose kinase [Clostridia bacterium]